MSSGVQPELEPQQPVYPLPSAWRHRRRGNSKAPGPRSSELKFRIPFGSRSREAGTVCLFLPQPTNGSLVQRPLYPTCTDSLHTHGAHTSHQCFPPGPWPSCFLGPRDSLHSSGYQLSLLSQREYRNLSPSMPAAGEAEIGNSGHRQQQGLISLS